MDHIRIYTGTPRDDTALLPILGQHFSRTDSTGMLFKDFFDQLDFGFLSVVERPEEADVLLVPHDYFQLKKVEGHDSYLAAFSELAEKYDRPLVLVAHGDSDENITVAHAIVLRTSQYTYKKRDHERIMAPYVEDILPDEGLILRNKKETPVVSFCGWAGFSSTMQYIKYVTKLGIQYVKRMLGNKHALLHRKGIYFRRKLIKHMKASSRVDTSFIIRDAYSGHKKTITLSPEQARKEYINNIIESDFVLAPKGDGNFSMRFYEALALGRFPILLDTGSELPLSDMVNYTDCVVRIDPSEMDTAAEKVAGFYAALSDEELKERQKKARDAFAHYLRIDRFFDITLRELARK